MIKMFLIGNLGRDAVVNTTQNGSVVINFSVAHTENYKDKDGNKVSKTTWVDCSWWTDKTAVAPYLLKGTQVFIEGQPDVKSFSKQDGSTGVALTLRVMSCQLLGGAKQQQSNGQAAPQSNTSFSQQAPPPVQTGENDADLPF